MHNGETPLKGITMDGCCWFVDVLRPVSAECKPVQANKKERKKEVFGTNNFTYVGRWRLFTDLNQM